MTAINVDQDSLLSLYTDAAEEYCENYCRQRFGNSLPSSVQAAALMLVGGFFNTRESIITGTIVADNPAIKALLDKFRDLRDYFGPSVDPSLMVPTDSETAFIGDDWSRAWRMSDEAGGINITGYTGTFTMYSGESVIHSGALSVSDAINGTFSYTLPDTFTATLLAEPYWYRVRALSPSGENTTLDRRQVIFA